jgi:regulator of protease activity HflC (stomatin/prohibitin superfamily)
MLDKVWQFIVDFIDLFRFWQIIDPYEKGVRIRLGVSDRVVMENGFHWKYPFAIDTIPTLRHVLSVKELGAQTVTSKDNSQVVIQAIVKYEIKDVVKAILDVDDEVEAVSELTQATIRSVAIKTDYSDMNTEDFEDKIKVLAKKEAEKWGIKIIAVTIKSLGEIPTLRIMQ